MTEDKTADYRRLLEEILHEVEKRRRGNACTPYHGNKSEIHRLGFVQMKQLLEYDPNIADVVKQIIINATLDGCYIEDCLEDIKKLAGMPDKTTKVSTDEMKRIDFLEYSKAMTEDIETCIAVATRNSTNGTLSHLTLKTNPEKFFNWFMDNVPKESCIYIAGGWEPNSCEYLDGIRSGLKERRYIITAEDVLEASNTYRQLTMMLSGVVEVLHYNKTRDSEGEHTIPLDLKYLV